MIFGRVNKAPYRNNARCYQVMMMWPSASESIQTMALRKYYRLFVIVFLQIRSNQMHKIKKIMLSKSIKRQLLKMQKQQRLNEIYEKNITTKTVAKQ